MLGNFLETLLSAIEPGMKAQINLVGYPGRTFHGVVQGIAEAYGESCQLRRRSLVVQRAVEGLLRRHILCRFTFFYILLP